MNFRLLADRPFASRREVLLKGRQMINAPLCRLLTLTATLPFIAADSANAQQLLTPEALMRVESIRNATISPDGRWLAYVRERPKTSQKRFHWDFQWDVWVAATSGGEPQNVTKGAATGAGYWNPKWSPKGDHLAMFATQDGTTRVFVWDAKSGLLRQVTDRNLGSGEEIAGHTSIAWLSDHSIICSVLPDGAWSHDLGSMGAVREAARERSESLQGAGTTASVLESGMPIDIKQRPRVELLRIDLDKGTRRLLSQAPAFDDIQVSPDQQHLALAEQSDAAHPTEAPLEYGTLSGANENRVYKLSVIDDNRVLADSDLTNQVVSGTLRWSVNSQEIAFVRQDAHLPKPTFQVVRCGLHPWQCTGLSLDDVLSGSLIDGYLSFSAVWAGDKILLRGNSGGADHSRQANDRRDWLLVSREGVVRNLTKGLDSIPSELFVEPDGKSAVALADGKLQRFWVEPERQSEVIIPGVTSILWPRSASWGGREAQEEVRTVLVAKRGENADGAEDIFRVDLASGQMTKVATLPPHTQLIDFSTTGNIAVTRSEEQAKTVVAMTREGEGKPRVIVEVNAFLEQIKAGQAKKIEYQSLDGQTLKGWLLLPVGYQDGKRYPLVTFVYAGDIYGDSQPVNYFLNWSNSLNSQLLAARGYAVLLPSMPLKAEGQPSDPFLELTKGVLPAVDKAIEMGIADPKRLAVMGHSYGGYSTYGLITQTNRFQAAISMAGLSDLASVYGTFDARYRYASHPQGSWYSMGWAEIGQSGMKGAPWKDPARYARNSPISYVERVQTPILIVQGDLDAVPLEQGEEFFTALYRQNKRAEFVRYWGEGHTISEPTNVEDMWHRIYAWFDEFLDISRDGRANLVWDGDRVKSRAGAPALKPEDFAQFEKLETDKGTR